MSQEDLDGDLSYVERDDSYTSVARHGAFSLPSEISSEPPSNDQGQELALSGGEQGRKSHSGKTPQKLEQKRPSRKVLENREAYRDFFNNTIEEITGHYVPPSERVFEPPSQIGASTWTSAEKETFFRKLPILGRDNTKELAAAIGSKSELEVHHYIQLLSEGVVEGTLTQDLDVYSATNIPAANEISQECEAALEVAADALAKDQLRREQKRETKKHGSYWLLTEDIAEEIEELLETPPKQGTPDGSQVDDEHSKSVDNGHETDRADLPVPAARLLNLANWLEVSQLFMWQGQDCAENWTDITKSSDETPSLYNTAFQDFHNIAVSLTRRLLQASIFQAQSRMRARGHFKSSNKVYAADIRAAAKVLDLDVNPRRFWGTLPRRHGLKVYVREEKQKHGDRTPVKEAKDYHYGNLLHMNYDEVEAKLGVAQRTDDTVESDAVDTIEDSSEIINHYDDADMWTDVSYSGSEEQTSTPIQTVDSDDEAPEDRTFQPSDDENEPHPQLPTVKGLDTRAMEKRLDAQVDSFDRHASSIEEARLWSLLNSAPPVEVKSEEHDLSAQLPLKRKTRNELRNWRDLIDYEAEWERATAQVPLDEFSAMQERGAVARKRRKMAREGAVQGVRRSTRLDPGESRIYETTDDEVEGPAVPSVPQPAEHFSVVWSPTAAREAQPMQSVEDVEPAELINDALDDTHQLPGGVDDTWPSPATSGMLDSPLLERRAQSAIIPSYQLVTARRRQAAATSSPALQRRETPMTRSQPLVKPARRSSLASQSSRNSIPAEVLLNSLARSRMSSPRKGTPSNPSRAPTEASLPPISDEDEAMGDVSDVNSDSSSDIDTTQKIFHRPTTPLRPTLPPKTTGSDGESDPDDKGWLATLRRTERAERKQSKEQE